MKFKKILTCLIISTFSLTSVYATTMHTKTKSSATMEMKQDAKTMGWLMSINRNEIMLAKLAKEKTHNKDVVDFANFMILQHGKNLAATEKLSHTLKIKPAMGGVAAEARKKGDEEKATLKKLNGKDFEKNYIDAMVAGHEKVLAAIDDTYLKDVNNPKLKKFLENTSKVVAHHLSEAKKIQTALASNS